ncbi:MAG: beta-ketoacyl-ACP synthase II [Candidatus Sungbacteria bacterium]|nr:beta-ketoacyl-ACP synthase II [Candidatus Sungbacteria bacterium]
MERIRVYAIGMGAVTPVGNSVPIMWNNLLNGASGIGYNTFSSYRRVTQDEYDNPTEDLYFQNSIAAEVKDFDPEQWIDKKDIRRFDPFAQFAIAAADEAVQQAGLLEITNGNRNRWGVFIGSGNGGQATNEYYHDLMRAKGARSVSSFMVPGIMLNAATAAVARIYGCQGDSATLTSACATGVDVLGLALERIRRGKVEVAIAGASDAVITPLTVAGFANMKALLKTYDGNPKESSRPFDRDRKGFVMGEGAGIMVLASEKFIEIHHLTPLAEIAGYGCAQDAYHLTAPDPDGTYAAKAIRNALNDAGIIPDQIGYINAHGTGTPLNDKMETIALKLALGRSIARDIPTSSTKSMIGHLIGAAGAVETIITALTLIYGKAHPTLNLDNVGPECAGLDHIIDRPRMIHTDYALKDAFGFGGTNSALILKRV